MPLLLSEISAVNMRIYRSKQSHDVPVDFNYTDVRLDAELLSSVLLMMLLNVGIKVQTFVGLIDPAFRGAIELT